MVQAGEHGPRDEPPLDNNVGRLKPKRMRLEAIGYFCLQAEKVGQKSICCAGEKSFVNPIFED